MTVGLDTSVVVRLLSGQPPEQALAAMRYLRALWEAGGRALVSDWVAAETYHAIQHHYGVSKRETLEGLRDFLDSPGIDASEALRAALTHPSLASAKPGFVDRLIHADYQRAGAEEMVTFEAAARRLGGVRLLAP